MSVTVDVGEGLLDHTEQSNLDFRRHLEQAFGYVRCDLNAGAIGNGSGVGVESGGKTDFFEHRGMKQSGDGADFA